MSYRLNVFVGAFLECLDNNKTFNENKIDQNLYKAKPYGSRMIYFLSNSSDKERSYGIHFTEGLDEFYKGIDELDLQIWKDNFETDYKKEIAILQKFYKNKEIVNLIKVGMLVWSN